MRIEVLLNQSAYFPGDDIYCFVQLEEEEKENQSVLWISGQIHGSMELDSNWKLVQSHNDKESSHSNSIVSSSPLDFGLAKNQHHRCLFVCKPVVLACDLSLQMNQHQSCMSISFVSFVTFY